MQFICTFLCKTALFGAIFCNFKFPITYVRFHLSAVQSGIYVAQSDRDRISDHRISGPLLDRIESRRPRSNTRNSAARNAPNRRRPSANWCYELENFSRNALPANQNVAHSIPLRNLRDLPIILSHLSALMMPVRRALHFSDPNRIFIRHSLQLLQAARSHRLLPAPGWRVPGHHRRWRRNSCVQQPRQNRLSAACRAVDDAARSR
jgi:hypothetical protein